jgi:hypothetical protein
LELEIEIIENEEELRVENRSQSDGTFSVDLDLWFTISNLKFQI